MIRSNYGNYDAIAAIQQARAQQIQSLMGRSSNFPYSTGGGNFNAPTGGNPWGYDTVTLGGQTWGGYSNSTPTANNWGYSTPTAGNWGYSSGDSGTMSNGQSIEDIFNNPFAGTDMGYLQEALDKIAAARRTYGVQPPKKEGQKGDLRVIAGDRSDGVKPKEVRIDDANNYDYQKAENSYQDNRQETRFKDGTIGREYDVTVTWEDGTTTRKRVKLKEAGQIVYIRSADGY